MRTFVLISFALVGTARAGEPHVLSRRPTADLAAPGTVDAIVARPALAVTASLAIPTMAQHMRDYDLALIDHATKDGGKLHQDFNIGPLFGQLEGPRAEQPWVALAATYAVPNAVEPHYFADAVPLARQDAGLVSAVELALRDWLVVDAAVDAIGWEQRSLTALVGVTVAPVRLRGPS